MVILTINMSIDEIYNIKMLILKCKKKSLCINILKYASLKVLNICTSTQVYTANKNMI